jgi:hypothetical protein
VLASVAYGTKMNIETLTIPDNLKIVGNNTYGDNSNYQTIVTVLDVPASAEEIPSVFYNKSTLKEINVAEGGANYSSDKGVLYNGDKTVLIKCPRSTDATAYIIADSTHTVSSSAFEGTGHKEIYFPAGIKIIGNNVFNPDLKIIYGYTGTVAQTYAEEQGFGFVSLGDVSDQPPVTTNPVVTTPSSTTEPPVVTTKPAVTTPVTTTEPPVVTAKPVTTAPAETTPPVSSENKLNYDVDGNGKVNIMDLLKLKKYLLS